MRVEVIIRQIGHLLLLNAIFMFVASLISVFNDETSTIPLLYSALMCFLFGLLPIVFVPNTKDLTIIEGISIVVIGWTITCIVGMLPYLLWGGEFSLINAWFESVSGYTTTGASILNNVESIPNGLLFWRSSTHFIGGIGVILFVLLILPQSNTSQLVLVHAEISDLSRSNFAANARKVIRILAIVYFGLILLESISLKIGGMTLFDAVNHSFATVATGGFSTKNLSIAFYDNVTIEIIIMIFMVLSGIHFGLLFGTITGGKRNLFSSSIARTYLMVLAAGIILVSLKLFLAGNYNFNSSIRYAAFQVISLGTTTGFATVDTVHWPSFTQILLIYFTIQCAMLGSTSGGLKFDRIFIFFKSLARQVTQQKHPRAVLVIKVDHVTIPEEIIRQTFVFTLVYIFIILLSTTLLTTMDMDLMTSFSASIATLGNVGPGFGDVGSMSNYASLPTMAKFILTITMLFGRLEIFNILALLTIRE